MQVNSITPFQPHFKAVNKRYIQLAKKDLEQNNNLSSKWLFDLYQDIFRLKDISKKDGIDTLEAVQSKLNYNDEFVDSFISDLKKLL